MELYLHIGSPKTGTTALQSFLKVNRKRLSRNGILGPLAFGGKKHVILPDLVKKVRTLSSDEDTSRYLDEASVELSEKLRAELQARDYHKAVFSSEFLWSRLTDTSDIKILHDFLKRFFDRVCIIAYIRRQDDYISSSWSTAVKGGETDPFSISWATRNLMQQIHYWKVLSRWEGVFGRENVIFRKYEKASLTGGDIVEDFLGVAGIDQGINFKKPESSNESLDAGSLEFLRLMNRYSEKADRPARFVRTLAGLSEGPWISLPEGTLNAFQAKYRESNRKVAIRYFGGEIAGSDDPLFLPRTSSRKQVTDYTLTTERAVEIAAFLLGRLGKKRGQPRQ